MSIIINEQNCLKNNLLIRKGYMATFENTDLKGMIEYYFQSNYRIFGNWYPGIWLRDGIQTTYQKYEPKMSELIQSKMDEKWFAIALLHVTAWNISYSESELDSEKYHSTSRIDLKELLNFIKKQNWSIEEIDNKYITHVDENYVHIKKELMIDFINEIKYQEKFLLNYAMKKFNEENINFEYLFIENEITGKIVEEFKKITILEEDSKIHIKNLSKDLIFELDVKNYIENYATIINQKEYYILTEKFIKDFEKFIKLNNKNHDISQIEFNELILKNPLLIEVKKQSKIQSKNTTKSLSNIQKEILNEWFSFNSFNELKEKLKKELINKLTNNKLIYSLKNDCEKIFKIGKNHVGLNVFIENEDKLKNLASDDINFGLRFIEYFNVKSIEEYSKEHESYDKNKDYIFFEVKNLLNLTKKEKSKINQILMQGRSQRNFIWFNIKEEEIIELKNSPLYWNIMSCYFDKKNISEDLKKEVHPQLWKVIKKVFINQNQCEFLIN